MEFLLLQRCRRIQHGAATSSYFSLSRAKCSIPLSICSLRILLGSFSLTAFSSCPPGGWVLWAGSLPWFPKTMPYYLHLEVGFPIGRRSLTGPPGLAAQHNFRVVSRLLNHSLQHFVFGIISHWSIEFGGQSSNQCIHLIEEDQAVNEPFSPKKSNQIIKNKGIFWVI